MWSITSPFKYPFLNGLISIGFKSICFLLLKAVKLLRYNKYYSELFTMIKMCVLADLAIRITDQTWGACALRILRWNIIFVLLLIGCSTTNIDWEEAHNIDTEKAYQNFLQKHPNSEYSELAKVKLETIDYENAKETDTVNGYSFYLLKCPHGTHVKEVRARLKDIRCNDPGYVKIFPSWLKKGLSTDPNRHASWYLANSYIGIEPNDIGRGYKDAGDDPEFPLELDWGAGQLIYYSGKGVIIGPNGKGVLVGYHCK